MSAMVCHVCHVKVTSGNERQAIRYRYTHRKNKARKWWQFWRPAWVCEKFEMKR